MPEAPAGPASPPRYPIPVDVKRDLEAGDAPMVGVVMGSRSDWETMRHASETLERLGVPHEVRVVSAHRTPELLSRYAA